MFRYFLVSMALLVVSFGIGTAGYHYYGNISRIDGFYNASMILSGMGPVNTMEHTAAKLFSSFYALFSGLVFLSTTAIIFAPLAHRMLHLIHIEDIQGSEEP